MTTFEVHPIGIIHNDGQAPFIELEPRYAPALRALEGFSHINVLWWFSACDIPEARAILETPQPYKKAPAAMGIFATRAPMRPNPLALTAVEVLAVEARQGIVHIAYIDADDGTPVLDLKPYTPSLDRVEAPAVPAWCAHWPKSLEASADFAWEAEFNF